MRTEQPHQDVTAEEAAATDELVRRVEAIIETLAATTAARIVAAMPAYERAIKDPGFSRDLSEHIRVHQLNLLAVVRGRAIEEDAYLPIVHRAATRRARMGVPLDDFLHAFRIGMRDVWSALMAASEGDPALSAAALRAAAPLMLYIDEVSTQAATSYLDSQQLLAADGDRARRDLLEDLLAGRNPTHASAREAAVAAGLEEDARLVVLSAALPEDGDVTGLPAIAGALARGLRGDTAPLVVVRRREAVVVAATGRIPEDEIELRARDAFAAAQGGTPLRLGVSTVHRGLASVRTAYDEAVFARDRAGADGFLALRDLRLLDFLIRVAPPTAIRLVSREVRQFLDRDLAKGGKHVLTLRAYLEADLGLQRAADALGVHPNTVRYRLSRTDEQTGMDTSRAGDVLELVAAADLLARDRATGA